MKFWYVADSRNGRRCGMASYSTREQADRAIQSWRDRDARGKRQDIHDLIPHMVAVEGADAGDGW